MLLAATPGVLRGLMKRRTNVEFLRSLPAAMAGRVAIHREAGDIILAQVLHEWALHDLGHIRQVAELV